jgi:hypothetical protein
MNNCSLNKMFINHLVQKWKKILIKKMNQLIIIIKNNLIKNKRISFDSTKKIKIINTMWIRYQQVKKQMSQLLILKIIIKVIKKSKY